MSSRMFRFLVVAAGCLCLTDLVTATASDEDRIPLTDENRDALGAPDISLEPCWELDSDVDPNDYGWGYDGGDSDDEHDDFLQVQSRNIRILSLTIGKGLGSS